MKLGSQAHTQHTCPVGQSSLAGVGEVPVGREHGEARTAHSMGSRAQARGRCMWVKSLAFSNFTLALPLPRHNKALGQRTGYASSGGRKRRGGRKKTTKIPERKPPSYFARAPVEFTPRVCQDPCAGETEVLQVPRGNVRQDWDSQ